MPYGRQRCSALRRRHWLFQSLIWVACPTGAPASARRERLRRVSIPHMGCMPYGPRRVSWSNLPSHSFNPSYGLHALRASRRAAALPAALYGFNPSYGLHALRALRVGAVYAVGGFQSLIWVACPTGAANTCLRRSARAFQSLIWVACPTGVNSDRRSQCLG